MTLFEEDKDVVVDEDDTSDAMKSATSLIANINLDTWVASDTMNE